MPGGYHTFGTIDPQPSIDILTEEYINIRHSGSFPYDEQDQISRDTKNEQKDKPSRGSSTSGTSHGQRKEVPILEYHNFGLSTGAFNLELWWYKSSRASRLNAFFILTLLLIAFIHAFGGIYFIISHLLSTSNTNPYICTTEECQDAAKWMKQTMDMSVEPCDNFYEFVCGNMEEVNDEVNVFIGYINAPGYKIQFGENSILAKILRSYSEEHEEFNQPIKYFQACLNDRNRDKYNLTAFVDAVEYIFGSKDMSTFESSSSALAMEEVGARMFQVTGHAVYMTMAFYSYPYIQLWLPVHWLSAPKFYYSFDPQTYHIVFQQIMPALNISANSIIITDMVNGIHLMMTIMQVIHRTYDTHLGWDPPTDFNLKGLCPPMGIQLDFQKVFKIFLGDIFRWVYETPKTKVFLEVLQVCFRENPSSFQNKHQFQYPKTALGIWMFGLIKDFIHDMDRKWVDTWNLDFSRELPNELLSFHGYHLEFQCLNELSRNLGYLPLTRHMQFSLDDPMEFVNKKVDEIQTLFDVMRQNWLKIPYESIWETERFLGKVILERGLEADVVMPIEKQLWDYSLDELKLSEDHLKNSIATVGYTVEKAKQNWIGSTDSNPHVKWWGEGSNEGTSVRFLLFAYEYNFFCAARFYERPEAARWGLWDTFLGRSLPNYILFPFSLYNEPHTSESLWLESGGITFKMFRTFMSLIQDTFSNGKYSNWMPANFIVAIDPTFQQEDYKCSSFDHSYLKQPPWRAPFDYKLSPFSLIKFTWYTDDEFMNTLAVKLTLKHFRDQRKSLLELPYGWHLDEKTRKVRLNRFLPGDFSKYSEEQMLLMAIVRQNCRGSWKKLGKDKDQRYALETTILNMMMQTEEFSQVWKCPKKSFMNLGDERCFKWIP